MDRIAFDLSLYWEHRELKLAIAPGQHAAQVSKRQADESHASAEQVEQAAKCAGHLGDLHAAMGQSGEALAAYRAGSVIAERLAAQDPLNANWQLDLGGSYNRIGGVLASQSDLASALQMFHKDLAIAELLAAKDPLNADWQRDLGVSYNRIGGVLESQGDLANALQMSQKALAIAERLAAQDPLNARWQSDLAYSLYKTGECHEQLGQFFEATCLWRRELEVRTAMASQTEDPRQRLTANCRVASTKLVVPLRPWATPKRHAKHTSIPCGFHRASWRLTPTTPTTPLSNAM